VATVYVYSGSGTFTGASAFAWNSPKVGMSHRFILFLTQEQDVDHPEAALRELSDFGFANLQLSPGKPLAIESLNLVEMRKFHSHYEGALAEGSSLVWYP
jgi:hypothetical protein